MHMMAFFMLYYKKTKLKMCPQINVKFICLKRLNVKYFLRHTVQVFLSLFLAFSSFVYAADNGEKLSSVNYNLIDIFTAQLVPSDDTYLLNAEADLAFGVALEQAVMKGFDLHFLVEFQLVSPREYWFDDEISTVSQHITLRYHALSRQFLVIRENTEKNAQQKAYPSLIEAQEDIGTIKDFKVINKNDLDRDATYKATLLIRLDRNKLPKALQVDAISSNDWKMVSQRYTWQPNLFK